MDHRLAAPGSTGDASSRTMSVAHRTWRCLRGGAFEVVRVLEFDDSQRQAVDEQRHVEPTLVFVLDHGELVDRQPVVGLPVVEVDCAGLRAPDRAVGGAVLHRHAFHQYAVKGAIAGLQRGPFRADQLAEGVVQRFGGKVGVEPGSRIDCSAWATIFALPAFRASSSAVSKSFRRFGLQAQSGLRSTPVDVDFGVVWLQVNRPVIIGDGVIVLSQCSLRNTPVEVGCDVIWLQADRPVIGRDAVFRAFVQAQITDRNPSSHGKISIAFFRDVSDSAPFLDGFLDFSSPLKQDGVGNRLVYQGCEGITSDTFRSPAGLVRVLTNSLGIQFFHKRLSLVAFCLDLLDKAPGFFCMLLGRRHILAGFGLDLAESLKTEIAGKDSANTEQRQEYGCSFEPPVDGVRPVIEKLASEFVEAALSIDFARGRDRRLSGHLGLHGRAFVRAVCVSRWARVGLALAAAGLAAAGALSMAGSAVCASAIIGTAAAIAAATSTVRIPAVNKRIIPLSRSVGCSCVSCIYPQLPGYEFRQQRVTQGGESITGAMPGPWATLQSRPKSLCMANQ